MWKGEKFYSNINVDLHNVQIIRRKTCVYTISSGTGQVNTIEMVNERTEILYCALGHHHLPAKEFSDNDRKNGRRRCKTCNWQRSWRQRRDSPYAWLLHRLRGMEKRRGCYLPRNFKADAVKKLVEETFGIRQPEKLAKMTLMRKDLTKPFSPIDNCTLVSHYEARRRGSIEGFRLSKLQNNKNPYDCDDEE